MSMALYNALSGNRLQGAPALSSTAPVTPGGESPSASPGPSLYDLLQMQNPQLIAAAKQPAPSPTPVLQGQAGLGKTGTMTSPNNDLAKKIGKTFGG